MTITGDGHVVYDGRTYVRHKGKRERTLAKDAVEALFAKVRCSGFESWRENYSETITDDPSAKVQIKIDGRSKSVVDYPPCHTGSVATPPALCDIEKAIDQVAHTAEWVECPSDAGLHGYCPR